jgi:hypothetical protein
MWTDKNRAKYNRDHLRYPSDLTDVVAYHPPHRRRNVARGIIGFSPPLLTIS